jgi:uncharacterized protein involved in exopolysaccharide biosynthesis
MEVQAQARKPTYKQTFRRHRKLLSLPMVLGALVASYFAMAATPQYQATASLWVDTAAPNPSSVGGQGIQISPAASEQSVLTELLATKSFAVEVAQNSLLGSYLASQGQGPLQKTAVDALEQLQVGSVIAGPQVLVISYTGPTEAVTTTTMQAIVKQLQKDNSGLTTQHTQAAVSYYTAQSTLAQKELTLARGQVANYLAANPKSNPQSDPNLSALMAAENSASTGLAQANTSLNQASAARSSGGWDVQVIDYPKSATSLAKGKKKMIEVILGGVLGGALVSFLATMALTPKLREPWEDELLDEPPTVAGVGPNRPDDGQFETRVMVLGSRATQDGGDQ